jgi:hypothetical protein
MEVMKHPHHVMHKKKWPEFVLEFFMLFLAVFLGFVAENIREHVTEGHKGKEYVESYYDDLKNDTARISWNIEFDARKLKGLEGLSDCYNAVLKNPKNTSCLMGIIQSIAINRPFTRTERTSRQLANAGGFRMLKQADADSIIAYDDAFDYVQDVQTTVYQDIQNTVRNTLNTIGNFKANVQMFKPEAGKMITADTLKRADITAPIIFSSDKALLNKFFNECLLYYRVTYNHQQMLIDLKARQIRLLDYFRRKYGFE